MSGNNIITVENLHKRFGSLHVLKGVTEHIGKGEVVSIIGPSGGGKSTFLPVSYTHLTLPTIA